MRDIPVVLSGYKLTVVEPPAPKTRDDGNGVQTLVTDRDGDHAVRGVAVRQAAGPARAAGAEG